MAAACVGAALNSILQSGQQPWPDWTILFLTIGGILLIIALLVLVPPSWWKRTARFLADIPRNLKTVWWLQSVLRFNKDNIHMSVKSARLLASDTTSAWNFRGLDVNSLDPYFQVSLELISTSIFNICVLEIEGKMRVDGSECQQCPTVDKRYGIKQGDTFRVTIRQSVHDTMLKRIQDAMQKKEELQFDLSSVFLNLETTTKGYEGTKIVVKFVAYNVVPN